MKIGLYLFVLTILIGLAVGIPTSCGDKLSAAESRVQLLVTRDFGSETVARSSAATVPAGQTVAELLDGDLALETGEDGSVESIEGYAAGRRDGRPVEWSYYVNGIRSTVPAATRRVAAGDHIWWDLHSPGALPAPPAVVGAFPEPFLSGLDGKRLPVRVDCTVSAENLCDEITTRLDEAGVSAVARTALNGAAGPELLRIVVGPWDEVRRDPTLSQLELSPERSGVFARFLENGRLALYDDRGRVQRTLGAGAGLVVATQFEGQQPAWVVTGTDAAGAAAAVTAFREETLSNRFGLAVQDGLPVGLPVEAPEDSR